MSRSQLRFPSPASSLRTAARNILHFSKRDVWYSVSVLMATLVPLLIAGRFSYLPGFFDGSSFLVLGAFFTMLAASDGTYGKRASTMGIGACLEAGACLAGTLLGNQPILAVAVMVFWAFSAGMLTVFGKTGGKLGFVAIASFVIALASPASLLQAGLRCAILLSGALWAMMLHLWAWPIKRYQPLNHAVARYYRALQAVLTTLRLNIAGNELEDERAPRGFWEQHTSLQNTRKEAHQILDKVHRGTCPTAQRLEFFLDRADGFFNVQILFAESLRTFPLQEYSPAVRETLVRAITVLERTLASLARAIEVDQSVARKNDLVKALQEIGERLAEAEALPAEKATALLAWAHLQHLLHLLKKLITLCQKSLSAMDMNLPTAPMASVRQRTSFRTTLAGAWRTLAEHLHTRSHVVRYALRLSISVSLATALFLFFRIPHGYWIAMSVIIMLKPDFHTTRQRARQRLGGTIVGGIFAGVLSLIVYQQGLLLLLIALFCFLAFLARSRYYNMYAFFLTAFLVFSLDLGHPGNWTVALIRVASTLIGAVLAYLSIFLLWPHWDKGGLPDQVGSALASVRHFFQGAISPYVIPSPPTRNMRELRFLASRECTRAVRLLERLSYEPWFSPKEQMCYATLRLSLRQLCETSIALSLLSSPPLRYDQRLPGVSRLLAQIEETLEDVEDTVRRGGFPGNVPHVQKHVQTLQETLREVLAASYKEQPPETFHRDLSNVPAPLLGVYLPSLVQTLRELSLAGNESARV